MWQKLGKQCSCYVLIWAACCFGFMNHLRMFNLPKNLFSSWRTMQDFFNITSIRYIINFLIRYFVAYTLKQFFVVWGNIGNTPIQSFRYEDVFSYVTPNIDRMTSCPYLLKPEQTPFSSRFCLKPGESRQWGHRRLKQRYLLQPPV